MRVNEEYGEYPTEKTSIGKKRGIACIWPNFTPKFVFSNGLRVGKISSKLSQTLTYLFSRVSTSFLQYQRAKFEKKFFSAHPNIKVKNKIIFKSKLLLCQI